MNLQEFQALFNPILKTATGRFIDRYQSLAGNQFPAAIIKYIEPLMMSGGKRARPYLLYLAYKSAGGRKIEKAMELGVALELFHLFALVRDDVIDRGDERHGIPTTHRVVTQELTAIQRVGDLMHIGDSQAHLIGDLLLNWAHEQFSGADWPTDRLAMAYREFLTMASEIIVGQMIDVDMTTRPSVDQAAIETKMRLKTAGYTFIHPMRIGVLLAGNNEALLRFCNDFGENLGIAFQIQDDLLDLTGDASHVRKTLFADVANRQHTVFTQYIFDHGTASEKESLRRLMGTKIKPADSQKVATLFDRSGAVTNGTHLMDDYFSRAGAALDATPIAPATKREWRQFMRLIRARQQ